VYSKHAVVSTLQFPLPQLSVLPYSVNDAVYVTPVALDPALLEVLVDVTLVLVAVVTPPDPARHW